MHLIVNKDERIIRYWLNNSALQDGFFIRSHGNITLYRQQYAKQTQLSQTDRDSCYNDNNNTGSKVIPTYEMTRLTANTDTVSLSVHL